MPSTYSPNLALELMATGEDLNTWGTKTNNNLSPLLEQAIVSKATVNIADANTTISMLNGTTCSARCFYLGLTGALTAQRNLVVPTINKSYVIYNGTTGGFGVQVKTTAGTGIIVQPGLSRFLYVDGTNVIEMLNSIQNLEVANDLLVDNDATVTGDLTVNGSLIFSGVLSGASGGTGVANTGKTITLGGNLTTVGAFATTLTATNTTTVTLPTTGTLATLAGAETLTNKTLTAPIIATISNTGTLTFPTSTDTLVGRATTDTLTNKTLTSPTLTSPTLTSPTMTAPVLGVATATSVAADVFTTTASNVNAQTGTSYTLVNGDNGKTVSMSNASASTLTVPASLTAGFSCAIVQLGAGQVTITASSTTLRNRNGLKMAGQYAQAGLLYVAADTYSVGGDLST